MSNEIAQNIEEDIGAQSLEVHDQGHRPFVALLLVAGAFVSFLLTSL